MKQSVNMLMLRSDSSIGPAIARTISLAFAHDPLIKWLRPNAVPWNTLSPEICKWQYRRIARAVLEGYVFYTRAVGKDMKISLSNTMLKSHTQIFEEEMIPSVDTSSNEIDATIILFPPESHLKWTFRRLMLACKLWFMDKLDPAPDEGTSMLRLEKLLTAHDHSLEEIRTKYRMRDLWYLEVIAVHPHSQGRGLGGTVMKWLLEYLNNAPVMLECTAESNVAFYERFGFKVVEEVELADESFAGNENTTKYWVMFKDRQL